MQINGGMEIAQENGGNSVAFASGSQSGYVIDGWQVLKSGTNTFSVQQIDSTITGFNKSIKATITTAQASIGTDFIVLQQPIEGTRFSKAKWGTSQAVPVTIVLKIKSSITGNFTVVAVDVPQTTAPSIAISITAANTEQLAVVTLPAQTSGTWGTGTGIGATFRVYLANSGQINLAATNGNTFEVTGFTVLPGIEAPHS